jgi:hypothetical protein
LPTLQNSPAPIVIRFRGETTDGKTRTFPDDARGKPLVLVVGLTQKSAKATDMWSTDLQTHLGERATIVGVAVLDHVPGFVRGFVKKAIDKDVGPPMPGEAGFVTTFDGATLRACAPAGNADDPVIYVFRADGSVASTVREPYSTAAAKDVEETVP